jgi:flavin reductase (DIM6/NTAB) family NADH-FMN oxidoreductase RutF
MKIRLGPSDVLFPVPAALVVSGTMDQPNIVTIAWIGMMGSDPPVVAISLRRDRYSLELIKLSKEFTVNIPSAGYFKEVDYCGLVSGRNRSKFEDIHFTPLKGKKTQTPIIEECPYNMECKVIREIELGEWHVVFAEVVETYVDEDKIDPATGRMDISKIQPLVYCATIREYWDLGRRLGKGFQAGLGIDRP